MNAADTRIEALYTPFECNFALTWAHAHLVDYLTQNPAVKPEEKVKYFSELVEGGLSLAKEFTRRT